MGKPLKNQLIRYRNVSWLVWVKFYSFLPLGEPKKLGVVILDKELGGISVPKAVLFDLGDTLIVEQAGKHLGKTPFDAIPQTEETLVALKQKGLKVGIIANTTISREKDVRKTLQQLGLENYFDFIVTSVDVGCEKPDGRIFSLALNALGIKASEAVMVGDRVATDIVGGNRLGMTTILFKWNQRYPETVTEQEEQPTFRIRHLRELLCVLDRIERSSHQ